MILAWFRVHLYIHVLMFNMSNLLHLSELVLSELRIELKLMFKQRVITVVVLATEMKFYKQLIHQP